MSCERSPTGVAMITDTAPLQEAETSQDSAQSSADASADTIVGTKRGPFARIVSMLGRADLGHLSDEDRDRILRGLFHEGHRFPRFARRFAALMTMSVLIAVMGLLADSTAVVIGAMLVAPLMGPVLGSAAALVIGEPRQFLRQLAVMTVGSAGAVGLAAGTSLIFPGSMDPLPAEIVARTSPNLLDLGIALAAGAAGAYAQIRRAAADALTGVAVAVALVPPLAVVGITLEIGEYAMSLGAVLLFLANVAGIIMSAAITFLLCGVAASRRVPARAGLVVGGLRWAALVVIIMVLPLHITRARVLPPTDPTEDIEHWIGTYLEDHGGATELVGVSVERLAAELSIDIVLTESGQVPVAEELADLLAGELQEPIIVSTQVVEVETDVARADGDPEGE